MMYVNFMVIVNSASEKKKEALSSYKPSYFGAKAYRIASPTATSAFRQMCKALRQQQQYILSYGVLQTDM